ncbi:hypothetical protein GTO91_02960 [Heliobacterium undosum]|uniref:Uncharacterized protein n=1 Tax=Heliomicrobium undosum TaxID=121734 RepID=A0A845L152_9FIRM|nr:hypothetical protein [Heliomicrobium undosum]MZP28679.1 hypothetical protein [Heliomicrobium undosum]
MARPTIRIPKPQSQQTKELREQRLAVLSEKRAKGTKLTLEDMDDKLNLILELIKEIRR